MRLGTVILIAVGLIGILFVGVFVGSSPSNTAVIFLPAVVGVLVTIYNPRIGLYFMLVLIPLQNLVIFESGSTLVRLVGIVVFAAWLLNKIFTRGSFRALFTKPVVPPMLAFLVLTLISYFWSNFGLWQTSMFTYIQLVVWTILLMDLIDSFEHLETVLFWVFIGSLVCALLSVYEFNAQVQAWQYSQRGRGGFNDPNYSSAMLMFILPYVFYRARYNMGLIRIAWLVSALVLLTGVAYTVSRTGLLSILLLLTGQFIQYSKAESRVKYFLLVIILLLITSPLWPWGNISYRFSTAWTGGSNQDLGQRIALMRLGWWLFSRHPILGQGIGYIAGQDVIHNVFLSLAVQLGMIGFLVMLWLWLTTWRSLTIARKHALRYLDERQINLISFVQLTALVYFFFSLSLATETSRPLWLLFALGSICYVIVQKKQLAEVIPQNPLIPELAQERK